MAHPNPNVQYLYDRGTERIDGIQNDPKLNAQAKETALLRLADEFHKAVVDADTLLNCGRIIAQEHGHRALEAWEAYSQLRQDAM